MKAYKIELSGCWWDLNPHEAFQVLDASAAQRCEAFLRVHDQWEE